MSEMNGKFHESPKTEDRPETEKPEADQDLDKLFDSYISGMSKEELIDLRNQLRGGQDGDDGDEPPEKVLKMTRH